MAYEILPHTADLRIRAEGRTLEELFCEMLRGLHEVQEPKERSGSSVIRPVRLEAPDREALLVEFLNEAVSLGDTHREVYYDVRFSQLTDTKLAGELVGSSYDTIALQMKAATHHGLRIEEHEGVFAATAVFDI